MEPIAYPNTAKEMRQRLLGRSATPPTALVTKSGATYWIKPCTLAQRGRIMEGAGIKGGETPTLSQLTHASILAAVALVVDANGAPVFEYADVDQLLDQPVGREAQEIMDAAGASMGGREMGEASEAAPAVDSSTT